MSSILVEAVLILVLVLANGVFAASEIAIVSSRRGRLEALADDGNKGARTALRLSDSPNRFLSTVQVGITLIGTFAAAFGGASIASVVAEQLRPTFVGAYADTVALALVVCAITYVSLILGELVPKRMALQNAEGIAVRIAPLMAMISKVASPVVWFLTASTELVLRLLGRHKVEEQPITEDDIMALVREGRAGGTVAISEQEFITSVFAFSDLSVRALMTPRTQVTALELGTPLAAAVEVARSSGYSRFPVYRGTLDHVEGLLLAKDLLAVDPGAELASLIRPAMFVHEHTPALKVFQQFKKRHEALAVVLDEYGQFAGIVTLEDLLEAIVGEIGDEYDEPAEQIIVRRDDGSFLIDGMASVDLLTRHPDLPALDALADRYAVETLAGVVLGLVGDIPNVGTRVTWNGYVFEVVDMDGRRIDRLLLSKAPPPAEPEA